MQDEKSLLAISVPEAGKRLGIGRSAAYAAAASGQLPVIRIGGLLRVPLRALERKLEAAAETPDDDA
jgi:excisionase family DNA binding protein